LRPKKQDKLGLSKKTKKNIPFVVETKKKRINISFVVETKKNRTKDHPPQRGSLGLTMYP
jgi:hypothetical protein